MADVRKLLKAKEDEINRFRIRVAELEATNKDLEHQLNIYRSLPVPGSPIRGHKKERGFGISAEPQALRTVTEASLKKYSKADK